MKNNINLSNLRENYYNKDLNESLESVNEYLSNSNSEYYNITNDQVLSSIDKIKNLLQLGELNTISLYYKSDNLDKPNVYEKITYIDYNSFCECVLKLDSNININPNTKLIKRNLRYIFDRPIKQEYPTDKDDYTVLIDIITAIKIFSVLNDPIHNKYGGEPYNKLLTLEKTQLFKLFGFYEEITEEIKTVNAKYIETNLLDHTYDIIKSIFHTPKNYRWKNINKENIITGSCKGLVYILDNLKKIDSLNEVTSIEIDELTDRLQLIIDNLNSVICKKYEE